MGDKHGQRQANGNGQCDALGKLPQRPVGRRWCVVLAVWVHGVSRPMTCRSTYMQQAPIKAPTQMPFHQPARKALAGVSTIVGSGSGGSRRWVRVVVRLSWIKVVSKKSRGAATPPKG